MTEANTKSKSKNICCVVQCTANSGGLFSVLRIDKEQSDAWVAAIHRMKSDGTPWIPSKHSRICGAHFRSGKPNKNRSHPDWCPSIFPTHHRKEQTNSNEERYERRFNRRASKIPVPVEREVPPSASVGCQTEPDVTGKSFNMFCSGVLQKKVKHVSDAWTQIDSIIKTENATSTETFHPDVKHKSTNTKEKPKNCLITEQVLNSDEKCRALCGVSLNLLIQTRNTLEGKFLKSCLSPDDQLVLYLAKLKTSQPIINVGTMFCVHKDTATKVFVHVLNIHFEFARSNLWWLTKQEVEATMPESFKPKYSNCRVIIDASEIKIQVPTSVSASVLCYSSYKSNHTLKFLIGIAPCGLITFMSRGYGGRITDAQITTQCGILDLLEPGDLVMADKGFPLIERDVMNKNSFLVMPPKHTQKRQFSEKENKETYAIASVRIHVERAIARMKRFGVLKFMENSLLKHANKILISISYLCNNMEALIREKQTENEPDLEREFEENGIQFCDCGECHQ